MTETREHHGDFEYWNFAENHIAIYLKGSSKYVALTGGGTEDTKQIEIPYPHRLVKIILRHTDSSNDDSTDNLDVSFRREEGQMFLPLLKDHLIETPDEKVPLIILKFGSGFEYEKTIWTLGLAGETATDRVHILMYIQRLGGKR
jgi:hypothetical protein